MTNILFIAFEFPPVNRGGVHRSLAFAKYLPQFGINPIVITLSPDSYNDIFLEGYQTDENLGKDVIKEATVIYAKSGKPPRLSRVGQFMSVYFSIHGTETDYWKEEFNRLASEAVAKYNIKAVLATVPPFSVLPLAADFAESAGLPLILDFRDAWSQWRMMPFGTIAHYWVNLLLERRYFNKAAKIVATSGQTLADFQKLHPRIPKDKFHYIPNGYAGDLEQWAAYTSSDKELVIGYVGSFYYEPKVRQEMMEPWWKKKGHRMLQYMPQIQDWLYRSPYFFFKALKRLRDVKPELAARIKVKFVGKIPDWLPAMIADAGLEGSVELLGPMPHARALAFQKECDMLLITSAKRVGGKDYSVAGKTFEYIQAQKPILAFVCESSQKDILEDSGMALICNPDDEEQSAAAMADFMTGKVALQPNFDFIKTLSRDYHAEQMAQVIDKAIQENS